MIDAGCPKCGAKKPAKIVWPFLDKDLIKKVESGKAVATCDLGYVWFCKKCEHRW